LAGRQAGRQQNNLKLYFVNHSVRQNPLGSDCSSTGTQLAPGFMSKALMISALGHIEGGFGDGWGAGFVM